MSDEEEIIKQENLQDKIEKFIDEEIRPFLQQDGGDIQVVELKSDGILRVMLHGACQSCPSSILTLKFGIERRLLEIFPNEVKSVELAGFGNFNVE
jgi:Fe-S cluster biogenesis protein NfuA